MENITFICPIDCGNAPKKIVLRDLILAFAEKDLNYISEFTADHIHWSIVGDRSFQGKKAVLQQVKQTETEKIVEIEILNLITHGKTTAVNGVLKAKDNTVYAFCNVCIFVSAGKNIIKEITSYVIKT